MTLSSVDRATKVFLALFLFFIPWHTYFSNILLGISVILFVIGRVAFAGEYGKPDVKSWKRLFSSVFVIYLFVFVSFIYTYDISETVKFAEYRISMFFLPLMFFFGFRLDRKAFEYILLGFVAGVLTKLLYFFGSGIYGIASGALEWRDYTFTHIEKLYGYTGVHRTYLSGYALFALMIVACSREVVYSLWFKIAAAVILLISIFSLESRSIFGITVALVLFFSFTQNKGRKMKTAVVTYGTLLLSVSLLLFTGSYKNMLHRVSSYTVAEFQTEGHTALGEFDSRASRWVASLDVIKERPLTGYGAGTEKEVMKEVYIQKGLHHSAFRMFDLHNQYLSLTLENGIFALLFYLYLLFAIFKRGFKDKYLLPCFFVAICAWMGLFDNILNTVRMIVFFTFISSALIFMPPAEEKEARVS